MSARLTFPCTLAIAVHLMLGAGTSARAADLILAGPHPFLKENALSVQFLMGSGLGDSFSGRGVGLGYGYMLNGPLWLDLQMNIRAATCSPDSACGPHTGSDAELLAGAAWRFRTPVPLVPYLRGNAGLVYLYPRAGKDAIGLAVRGSAGAKYFVFDWLGFGLEAALSLGHGYFAADYAGDHTYAVFDVALGVEWQFL